MTLKKSDAKSETAVAQVGDQLFKDALIENKPAEPASPAKTENKGATPAEVTPIKAPVMSAEFEDWAVVVDDSPASSNVVAGILKTVGVGTHTYRSARAALKFLHELNESDYKRIIAVFSDLQMPDMNGVELLTKLRAEARTKEMPFIVISGHIDKTVLPKIAALKIDGYIVKPFKSQSIIDRVTHLKSATGKAKPA